MSTGVDRVVGREAELRILSDLLREARAGRGGAALVLGEAGIGKTTVAEEAARIAQREGMRVAWGVCSPTEMPTGWPWTQALRALDDTIAAGFEAPDQASRPALLAAAVDALRFATAAAPAVVVIEDAHWADVASLTLLHLLASAVRGLALTLVVTARDEVGEEPTDSTLSLAELPTSVIRLPLHGLDREATAAIVAGVTGAPAGADVVERIHARTAGNPFFVAEVARLWTMRGEAAGVEVPPGVGQILQRRLARLSQPASLLLAAAAVLGEPDLDLLVLMTDMPADDALALLEAPVAARVLTSTPEGTVFAHALIRDTVYDALGPTARGRLHRRAAQALEAHRPEDHAGIAAHWASSGGADAMRRAAEHAYLAGQEALAHLGYEQAVRYYRWALEGGAADQLGVLLGLGEAEVLAGALASGRRTLRDAAREAMRLERGEALARAVLAMGTGVGGFEVDVYDVDQRDLLGAALRLLGDQDSSARAAVMARLSLALAEVASADERAHMARAAAEMAGRIGDRGVEVSSLAALCDALSGPDHVGTRLEVTDRMMGISAQLRNPVLGLLTRRLRLVALLEHGNAAAVDNEIVEYAAVADRLRLPILQWPVPIWRGMRALMNGDCDAAWSWSEEASAIGRRAGSPNAEMMVFTLRLAIARRRGTVRDLLPVIETDPWNFSERNPATWCMLAAVYVDTGDHERARAYLRRIMERGLGSVVPDDSERLEFLWLLGDAAIALQEIEAARAVHDGLAPYAELWAVDGMGGACFGQVRQQLDNLAGFLGGQERGDHSYGAAVAATRAGTDEGALVRRGAVWELHWRGRSALVRDSKGLRDIARLVMEPGVGVHVLELVEGAGGPPAAAAGGDTGDLLDARAREEYRRRIADLEDEIRQADGHADLARAEACRAEREAILSALRRALGLGGRPRRGGDRIERARTAVTTRIGTTLRGIEDAHPELARHLRASLSTGRVCMYSPERPVSWTVA